MNYIHPETQLKELKGTIPLKSSNFRNERKFRVYAISYPELLNIVRLNPFLFREIYYQRTVNNIYLDSLELDSFFDNVDGYSKRRKVRVRWYGDDLTEVSSPKLEFKIKYKINIISSLFITYFINNINNFFTFTERTFTERS